MGAGEFLRAEYIAFFACTLGNAAARVRNGAIAFVCMDWRHMLELMTAGERVFDSLSNVCVWNRTTGGLGSFYLSQHELVFVYKVGKGLIRTFSA
jgi:hypothetical protein